MKTTKLRRIGLSVSAVVLMFTLIGSDAVIAGAARANKSLLQKGMDYYNGKSITFVSPAAPGGGLDTSVRSLAPYIASYLHATVNVENVPGGNAVAGADMAAASPHNGLTLGALDSLNDVQHYVEGLPGITFDITKQDYVGSSQSEATYGWVESNAKNCPTLSSWNDLLNYGSSSNRLKVITETAGTTTTLADLALATFKQNTQLIAAYSSESLLLSGFQRGDACVVTAGANKLAPFIQTGFAHPLALTAAAPAADTTEYAGTPTFAQLIKTDKKLITTRTQRVAAQAILTFSVGLPSFVFLPRGTPTDEVSAMSAAVKWAAHNANYIAFITALGDTSSYYNGATDLAHLKVALKSMKPFKSVLLNS